MNALNIYIVDEINNQLNSPIYSGVAFGTDTNRLLIIDTDISETPLKKTLEHEIGHCFGLYHTFHTGFLINQPNSCERVTRDPLNPLYNAIEAGDFMSDTNAIVQLDHTNVNQTTCVKNNVQLVNCFNENLIVTNEDITNFMNYCLHCADKFTIEQKERMHESLVLQSQIISTENSNIDLFVRNSEVDFGDVPDNISEYLWESPDIWIRNSDDDGLEHQNPISNTNNYVYVRITNKSCLTSIGNETLKLNWTKAGTNLPIQVWEGDFNTNSLNLGGLINEIVIPPIEGYKTKILKFIWSTPNLQTNEFIEEPWHYCILAKINTDEIENFPLTDGYSYLFRNSNNIALKNVTLIENGINKTSGSIFVGNFNNIPKNITLKIITDSKEINNTLFEEAEVKLKLDPFLYSIWENSNFKGKNIKKIGNNILVKENSEITFTNFPINKIGVLNLSVNFLTQNSSSKDLFKFHLIELDDENKVLGGEKFIVKKNPRINFKAEFHQNNNLITASTINEPATYKWYDLNGNLIDVNQSLINENINQDLILEVIAMDGFKDYVEIKNQSTDLVIQSIYPNPISDNTQIVLSKKSSSGMYFMLVNINNLSTANYLIPENITNISLNLQNIPNGNYKIVLLQGNTIIDNKNLIKNQ